MAVDRTREGEEKNSFECWVGERLENSSSKLDFLIRDKISFVSALMPVVRGSRWCSWALYCYLDERGCLVGLESRSLWNNM